MERGRGRSAGGAQQRGRGDGGGGGATSAAAAAGAGQLGVGHVLALKSVKLTQTCRGNKKASQGVRGAYQVGDVVPDVGQRVVLVSGKLLLLLLLLLPVVLQRREPRPRAVEEVAARAEAALLLGTPL